MRNVHGSGMFRYVRGLSSQLGLFNIVLSWQIESLALAPWALAVEKILPTPSVCDRPQKGLPMLLTLLTLLAALLLRFNADSEDGGKFTKGHASLIPCELEKCRALAWRLPVHESWMRFKSSVHSSLCRSHANCWVCRFRTWTSVASDIEQGRRVDWDAGLGETQKGNRVSKHRKCPPTVTLHFRCKMRNMLALARRPQIPVTENQSANVSLQGLHFISFPRFQYFQ